MSLEYIFVLEVLDPTKCEIEVDLVVDFLRRPFVSMSKVRIELLFDA